MKKVAILGAGKIGRAVAALLDSTGDYDVTLADGVASVAASASIGLENTLGVEMKLDDNSAMKDVLDGKDAVVSCLPFACNPRVAELALRYGLHYLDLTEDVAVTRRVRELAKNADCAFIPQCGLAPGFITITACHLIKKLDTIDRLKMRVGALPLYPANMLRYNLTWSTDGLINEYGNLCEVIHRGKRQEVLPLEGLETLIVDGTDYEAFNTSGGLGTLCDTLEGKVNSLDYKSIRYPGHQELIRFLMNDLRLNDDRETLKRIFERALPTTFQDVIVIYVSATGEANGRYVEHTYAHSIPHQVIDGRSWTGIQITTAAGITGVLDLLLVDEKLPQKGFIRQEEIDYDLFLKNRFGRYYARTNEILA
ncbi:MAG: saccharopine dehydrogenase C-terminal domain-containing protein [Planctomycetota bacterium]|nr:saccharopine dehydrogenase C-terminal domain-containing protein [Planctomycetota bacterium]